MSSPRSHPSSSAAAPLDDEDLLSEILLRLPPLPSSLPRASLACKLWRRIVSDARFLRRFHEHHRLNPPLLGCFVQGISPVHFEPTLEAPNRVPQARFSFPIDAGDYCLPIGCRHGLALIFHPWRKLLVWDPITGDQHRLDIPPGFNREKTISGAVLRAAGEVHHFQVVLVGNSDIQHRQSVASVYSSETGVWGDLTSTLLPAKDPTSDVPTRVYSIMCSVMVGNSIYWLLIGNWFGILEFDLDRQSLSVIDVPVDVDADNCSFTVMQAEGGGLGFLFLSGHCVQLWKRKTDCDGVASWVLGRTVALDKLLSMNSEEGSQSPRILGFAEDNNAVLVWTFIGVFMVQFESLQFKKLFETYRWFRYYPFEDVYTAGKKKPSCFIVLYCYYCVMWFESEVADTSSVYSMDVHIVK